MDNEIEKKELVKAKKHFRKDILNSAAQVITLISIIMIGFSMTRIANSNLETFRVLTDRISSLEKKVVKLENEITTQVEPKSIALPEDYEGEATEVYPSMGAAMKAADDLMRSGEIDNKGYRVSVIPSCLFVYEDGTEETKDGYAVEWSNFTSLEDSV